MADTKVVIDLGETSKEDYAAQVTQEVNTQVQV